MLFSKLAEYFERLEQTSSRLALIDILSELFKEVKASEIAKVCFLIQGRVAPFYEPIEIGMAEKTVAASIARAYGVEREEVLKEYGKVGDLGKVALHLSFPRKRESIKMKNGSRISRACDLTVFKSGMTVEDVFNVLTEIAKTNGVGTVEKKQTLLVDLLQKLDPISAKHLVRIPLGTSRLGIGDPTILDAFAQAKLGDRKNRGELEGAYNKISDLSLIAETLWSKGIEGVRRLDVTVGRPIRPQLTERLPDPKTVLEKFGGEIHVQYKYDGFRIEIHKKGKEVRLFSRNLEETTLMFPEIIRGVLDQIKADSVILDSEAVAFNPESDEFLPFQETTKRRRKYKIEEMSKSLPLKAFVFDIMYLNGKSLTDMPLRERVKKIEEVVSGSKILVPQPGQIFSSAEEVTEMFNDALTKGLEGLVVKRPD
ncbi:MAG: ATP-dependent DNA ligase, partial [Candidatus Daviesbacteria bacterium]|nr:ATP-dependent DNA ligase [Candidatus Daviesbacteria bacterium]